MTKEEREWIDKGLYWAWYPTAPPAKKPPTKKRLEYAVITFPHSQKTPNQRICCTIFDDEKRSEWLAGRLEIKYYENRGAAIKWPASESIKETAND